MFGMETLEFVLYLKQLGVVLAGSASLWGLVFAVHNKRETSEHKCLIYEWVSRKLLILFSGAFLLGLLSYMWLFIFYPIDSLHAHEGIVIVPTMGEIFSSLELTLPFMLIWALVVGAFFLYRSRKEISALSLLPYFYGFNLLMAIIVVSTYAWTGEFSTTQLFFFGHGFHSILTLGTVLTLDFLFLISASSDYLKQHIFPFFPTLSKVIWVGLGIDFLSVALVFQEALVLTPKFFFMQTLIGIVIINGVILSGPLTRKLLESIKRGGVAMTEKWTRASSLCGVISVSTWMTITFVDFFHNLTLGYGVLIGIYAAIIALLFIGHELWERYNPLRPHWENAFEMPGKMSGKHS